MLNNQRVNNKNYYLWALLVSLSLVLLVFPDVIFLGTTINMTSLLKGAQYNLELVKFLPDPLHWMWHYNINDAGGAVAQSEPMVHFIRHVIRHFESPYWNPYSSAGALGPETLVDLKFSFLTVIVALLGGSTFAFDFTMLVFYVGALYFLFLTLTKHFNLSKYAATVAAILYLLNGYSVSNLSSNVAQSYLYFPITLFALCSFIKSPSAWRFVFVVFCNILILSCTFYPTSFLVLFSIYIVSFGYTLSLYRKNAKSVIMITTFLASSGILAFLGLALVYFPIIESFSFLNVLEMYNQRFFYAAKWPGLLSFFSPRHFFDSYNAIDPIIHSWYKPTDPGITKENLQNASLIGNSVFHFGVLASLVAAGVLTRWRSHSAFIISTLLFVFFIAMGRIFSMPGIFEGVGFVYGLRSLGEQYWWMAVAIVFPIIVGFGFDAFREKRAKWLPLLLVYAIILSTSLYLYQVFGFIDPYRDHRIFSVISLAGIVVASFFLLWKFKKTTSTRTLNILSCLLVVLIFGELTLYSHHMRYVRSDIFKKPLTEVAFLKEHAELNRVVTLGWYGLTAEYGAAFQIQQIESMNMNIVPAYAKFFNNNFLPDSSQRWGDFPTFHNVTDNPTLNLAMLDFLAVKYVVVPVTFENYKNYFLGSGYKKVLETPWAVIFENPKVFPRVFAASALIENAGTPDREGLSLRDVVFTEDQKLLTLAKEAGITTDIKDPAQISSIPDQALQMQAYHHASITAKANLSKPAILVLPDNWHPNWRARIDGKEAYIGLVNETFRGMVLPAGEHTIEMNYRPKTLTLALYVTSVTCFLLVLIIIRRKRFNSWLKNHIK